MKKGWIRIVEAVFAILIVLSTVLFVYNKTVNLNYKERILEKERLILEMVANNDSLRSELLSGNTKHTEEVVRKILPQSWDFSIKVCELDEVCYGVVPYDKEVYSSEIIISANLTYYTRIKRVKLFAWRK